MAIKRDEYRVSDLSGERAEGTREVKFSLDKVSGKLDLTPGEVSTLEGILAPYFAAVEDAKSATGATNDRDENREIREWARANGHEVNDRGAIPAKVKRDFYASQSETEDAGNGNDANTSGSSKAKSK